MALADMPIAYQIK